MKELLKVIPGVKEYNIVPPDMEYDYYCFADEHPFRPEVKGYDPVNAWWLAEASLLVYAPARFAEYAFALKTGMRRFRFFKGKTTEAFVVANDSFAIVSFRGTEVTSFNAVFDIITDMRFKLVPFGSTEGAKVHQGFKQALLETWDETDGIKAFLDTLKAENPALKVWFTGHSMGGAMATLAAADFGEVQGLYTFGSPKVGNRLFADAYKPETCRFINNGDVIIYLPPDLVLNNSDDGPYTHVGSPYFITCEGEVVPFDESTDLPVPVTTSLGGFFKDRLQKVLRSLDTLDFKSLKESAAETVDHAPLFYVLKLWNSLISSL
jgi:dienelactone hydrolase